MKTLAIKQGCFRLKHYHTLSLPMLTINEGEHLAIIGKNGSGKSAVAAALTGNLLLLHGHYENFFEKIHRLSFEQTQHLINAERDQLNNDFLSDDNAHPFSHTSQQILLANVEESADTLAQCQQLADQFAISHLLQQPFISLSTGEMRKVLLCQSLITQPDLLILDEPFDGLDSISSQQWMAALTKLNEGTVTLILIVNRLNEIPPFIKHYAIIDNLVLQPLTKAPASLLTAQSLNNSLQDITLPARAASSFYKPLPLDKPLIILRNGQIRYQNRVIIAGLDWQVDPNQHWHIIGPNGAGKSTLLSLITGDHPQGYCNDLTLFGRRRGSGETLWQIKQHIGYVSYQLHIDYRLNISLRDVLLSGYFDTIGLYQIASSEQQWLVNQWLALLNLTSVADKAFHTLSWGQQRLVLITRALVKYPTLLILDEPLQGLDTASRMMIRHWIDYLIRAGHSQLLFVSHHVDDAPDCITHRLHFIAEGDRYRYQQEVLTD